MFFYWLWFKRSLLSLRNLFQWSAMFSLLSLILGVASLTTALLFINGFSSGLERSIVDLSGHVIVISKQDQKSELFLQKLKPYQDFLKGQALFLSSQALAVHSNQFEMLQVESLEDAWYQNSSALKSRLLEGSIKTSENGIVIGQALAKKMNLKINSPLTLVTFQGDSSFFSRKKKTFQVDAIADFGWHKFNLRYVSLPLSTLQKMEGKTSYVSGVRLWLKEGDQSEKIARLINNSWGENYQAYLWKDLNRGFFEAIEMDKKIIFFVLLILIFSAGFNVSSSLFVQVFRQTKDIGILKSMGAKKTLIRNIFILQGLIIGCIGTSLGILLAWLLSFGLVQLQNQLHFIPQEVYKVNQMVLEWDWKDMSLVFFLSLLVVIISSLWPAKRAYQLQVKETLSYE